MAMMSCNEGKRVSLRYRYQFQHLLSPACKSRFASNWYGREESNLG